MQWTAGGFINFIAADYGDCTRINLLYRRIEPPLVSGMGEANDIYICRGSENLDALLEDAYYAEFLMDELQERFPGLAEADLESPVPRDDAPWNVMLGAERRRIHIIAYDYAAPGTACVKEGSIIIQTRSLRRCQDLPNSCIGQYLTKRSVTFDRFVNGKKVPTTVRCAGSLAIIVKEPQDFSLTEHYAELVRQHGGHPAVLETGYRSITPVIEPLVDDSWRRSLQ